MQAQQAAAATAAQSQKKAAQKAALKASKNVQKQQLAQKAKDQQKAAAAIKAGQQEAQKKAAAAAAAGGAGPAAAAAAAAAAGAKRAAQSHVTAAQAAAAQQAHSTAAEQLNFAQEFQKHSLQRVTHLAQQNRFHEDQLHLLNLTSHVHNAMKNRRNVATCVELSTERAKSLTQEELYKALLVYMERKGYTQAALHHGASATKTLAACCCCAEIIPIVPIFVVTTGCDVAVRSGPAKCSGLSEFVLEQTFEYKAQEASNHMLQLLRANEDPAFYEQQYAAMERWSAHTTRVSPLVVRPLAVFHIHDTERENGHS